MRIYCKTAPGEMIDYISMKLSPHTAPAITTMKKLFPDAKYIFNTRHPRTSMISHLKVFSEFENDLCHLLGFMHRHNAQSFGFQVIHQRQCEKKLRKKVSNWYSNHTHGQLSALFYAGSFVTYLLDKDMYDYVVLYEDLSQHSEKVTRDMLTLMEIPPEHLEKTMEVFTRDSQQGALGKRGHWEKANLISKKSWDEMDSIFEQMGLPLKCNMSEEEYRKVVVNGMLKH